MAKKKSTGVVVALIMLKTFVVVLLMLLVGVGSYKATMKYYETTEGGPGSKDMLDIVGDATADAVSRNLIYSVEADKEKITAMVIEVLNTETGNLDYITIPDNFQFLINNDMYQRLYAAGVDVPQVMKMSQLNQYFTDSSSYEYGVILLENYFNIDIGYYTVMPEDQFNAAFTKDAETGCMKVSDACLLERGNIADVKAMEQYIKDKYSNYTTNIKIKSKAKYAETYFNVNPEMIYYYIMPGQEENGGCVVDSTEGQNMYQHVVNSTTHKTAQVLVKNIPAKNLKIKVLNGSGGTGIAGKVKTILENDDIPVLKIADNPEKLEKTLIKVRKEGMGNDLLKYFNGATLEVSEIEKGFDVIIIVGDLDIDIQQK